MSPYSPALNPIEYAWAFIKKKDMNKKVYDEKTLIFAIY